MWLDLLVSIGRVGWYNSLGRQRCWSYVASIEFMNATSHPKQNLCSIKDNSFMSCRSSVNSVPSANTSKDCCTGLCAPCVQWNVGKHCQNWAPYLINSERELSTNYTGKSWQRNSTVLSYQRRAALSAWLPRWLEVTSFILKYQGPMLVSCSMSLKAVQPSTELRTP